MPTNDDMTAPLTRRDLEEVLDQRLANHPTRTELDETLRTALANHPTHAELRDTLRTALANHPTHAELRETLHTALANHPSHAQLAESFAQFRKELRAEIADDTRTTMTVLLEDAFKRFRVIDDQYNDLPGRVTKLERAVFPPPRGRRKRAG
jgi:hypothetical protein